MKRITQEEWLMRAALGLAGIATGATFEGRVTTAGTCLVVLLAVLLMIHLPEKPRNGNGKAKAEGK